MATTAQRWTMTIGTANFAQELTQNLHGEPQPAGWLAFGPIHILPALFMLVYRDRVVRTLALRWLARRGESARQELEMHRPSSTRGNLVEVEQAVIGSTGAVDLNGVAMVDEDDEYK